MQGSGRRASRESLPPTPSTPFGRVSRGVLPPVPCTGKPAGHDVASPARATAGSPHVDPGGAESRACVAPRRKSELITRPVRDRKRASGDRALLERGRAGVAAPHGPRATLHRHEADDKTHAGRDE